MNQSIAFALSAEKHDEIVSRALLLTYTEATHRVRLYQRTPPGDPNPGTFTVTRVQYFDELGGFVVTEDQVVYWIGHHTLQPHYYLLPLVQHGEVIQRGDEPAAHWPIVSDLELLPLTNDDARPWTPAEMTDMLLQRLIGLAEYWAKVDLSSPQLATSEPELEQRLNGLLFSVLSTLDGANMDLPAFTLLSCAHPDSKAWYQEGGQNWWPEVTEDGDEVTGTALNPGLHERLTALQSELRAKRKPAAALSDIPEL